MPPSRDYVLPESVINTAFWLIRYVYIRACWLFHRVASVGAARALEESAPPDTVGLVFSINVGCGIPKHPATAGYAFVSRLGMLGDAQNIGYTKIWGGHGGERKAVMLWSLDVIQQVAAEGHPSCKPGRCGEQITISGVDWGMVRTGARVQVGRDVMLEVTYLKPPCANQEPNFTEIGDGMERINPERYPNASRVHTRVLRSGYVAAGDRVKVFKSPRAVSGKVVRYKKDPSVCISTEYGDD